MTKELEINKLFKKISLNESKTKKDLKHSASKSTGLVFSIVDFKKLGQDILAYTKEINDNKPIKDLLLGLNIKDK